jgi:nickel/cobalt transporter (NiCoT) family protein
MIERSRHMYALALLFGMGFDTATEIGLLGISAREASKGVSFNAILVFPMLFAAGMSLIDTTDNVLMLGAYAYGWAFVKPVRKLYYNMTITGISVIVALAIGGIEVLALIADQFHPTRGFWVVTVRLNESFGELGYAIVGLFVLSWLVSMAVYKWRGFDRIEITQRISIESER